MKKTFLFLMIMTTIMTLKAQDVRRTFGVGLQSSFPVYGISLKYGLTDQSVVQATIAPFGVSSDGGSASLNFYGLRYIHRFPGEEGSGVILDPYLFVGGGLLSYKTNFTAIGGTKTSDNSVGYAAGGGLELIVAKRFGISAELGYGKMSFSGGIAINTVTYGGGLHFYIN